MSILRKPNKKPWEQKEISTIQLPFLGFKEIDQLAAKRKFVENINILVKFFYRDINLKKLVESPLYLLDKTILKDKKDLPKKVRLNCSETVARLMIEQNVTEYVNSSFYYDVKTIKLVNSDEDNCIYTYSVIYRSRQFSDIYSSHKFKVNYTEDGMVNMEQVN